MSLELVSKNPPGLEKEANYLISNVSFDIAPFVIPFSDLIQKRDRLDKYSGQENITFANRDPEYKNILLSEFL